MTYYVKWYDDNNICDCDNQEKNEIQGFQKRLPFTKLKNISNLFSDDRKSKIF